MKELVIGTRSSPLALWQTEWVRSLLLERGIETRLERIQTSGDKQLTGPLADKGGKGLFVKELEQALLEGAIDFAVHSLKDVPTVLLPGFELSAFLPRADPRDCLIAREGQSTLADLKQGARVGSCSPRRISQALFLRPDLRMEDLRGNVGTRLDKVRSGEMDATFLAKAGLDRLGMSADPLVHPLDPNLMLPAAGQGIVAIEQRAGREEIRKVLASLEEVASRRAALAERALVRCLEGTCTSPIGAHAQVAGDRIALSACVGDPAGKRVLRDSLEAPADRAEELGTALAERLLDQGAGDLIGRA